MRKKRFLQFCFGVFFCIGMALPYRNSCGFDRMQLSPVSIFMSLARFDKAIDEIVYDLVEIKKYGILSLRQESKTRATLPDVKAKELSDDVNGVILRKGSMAAFYGTETLGGLFSLPILDEFEKPIQIEKLAEDDIARRLQSSFLFICKLGVEDTFETEGLIQRVKSVVSPEKMTHVCVPAHLYALAKRVFERTGVRVIKVEGLIERDVLVGQRKHHLMVPDYESVLPNVLADNRSDAVWAHLFAIPPLAIDNENVQFLLESYTSAQKTLEETGLDDSDITIQRAIKNGNVLSVTKGAKSYFAGAAVLNVQKADYFLGDEVVTRPFDRDFRFMDSDLDRLSIPLFVVEGNANLFVKRESGLWIGEELLAQIIKHDRSLFSKINKLSVGERDDAIISELNPLLKVAVKRNRLREKLVDSLLYGEDITKMVAEDKADVMDILYDLASMKHDVSFYVVAEARKAVIPLLIEAQNRNLWSLKLTSDDMALIMKKTDDLSALNVTQKAFLAESLHAAYAQRSLAVERVLRKLMQDDPYVRHIAISSLQTLYQYQEGMAVYEDHISYFPEKETIQSLLELAPEEEDAILALHELVSLNVYYVLNAIGFDSLTLAENFDPDRKWLNILKALFEIPEEKKTVHFAAQDIAIRVLSSISGQYDLNGKPFFVEDDLRFVLDKMVDRLVSGLETLKRTEKMKDRYQISNYLQENLGRYMSLQIPYRLREVFDAIVELMDETTSITDKISLVRYMGRMRWWSFPERYSKYRYYINDWFKMRFLENKEEFTDDYSAVHKLNVADMEITVYWQNEAYKVGAKVDGLFENPIAVGDTIQFDEKHGKYRPEGLSPQLQIHDADTKLLKSKDVSSYTLSVSGLPVYVHIVVKNHSIKNGKLMGEISEIRVLGYEDFIRKGEVTVVKSSPVLYSEVLENYDFYQSEDEVKRMMKLLSHSSPLVRSAAFSRITPQLVLKYPAYYEAVLSFIQEEWPHEKNTQVLYSIVQTLLSLNQYLKDDLLRAKASDSLSYVEKEYLTRSTQNIHVLNALSYAKACMKTSNKVIRFARGSKFANMFSDEKELLQDLFVEIKQYFRKFDSEWNSTDDESVAGISVSNLIESNLQVKTLFNLFSVLKHEVRHRTVKYNADLSYKQNELLSRIEDALSIKFLERQRMTITDPRLLELWDFQIQLKKYGLGTFLHSTYGEPSEEMDQVLEKILDVDVTRDEWLVDMVNQVLSGVESDFDVYVPRLTEQELRYMDNLFRSGDNYLTYNLNPMIAQLMPTVQKLIDKQIEIIRLDLSPDQAKALANAMGQMVMMDLTRMTFYLEEDLNQRLVERLTDENQKKLMQQLILSFSEEFNDLSNPLTGQDIWHHFIRQCLASSNYFKGSTARDRLLTLSWKIFANESGKERAKHFSKMVADRVNNSIIVSPVDQMTALRDAEQFVQQAA